MIAELKLLSGKKIILDYLDEDIHRFSWCKIQYFDGKIQETLYEDFLYVFVIGMLGSLRNINEIFSSELFGQIGKWQEYYYYSKEEIAENKEFIHQMYSSGFLSMEHYEIHLYRYRDKNWLEFNRVYRCNEKITPIEFYFSPENYRIFFEELTDEVIVEWIKILEKLEPYCKLL